MSFRHGSSMKTGVQGPWHPRLDRGVRPFWFGLVQWWLAVVWLRLCYDLCTEVFPAHDRLQPFSDLSARAVAAIFYLGALSAIFLSVYSLQRGRRAGLALAATGLACLLVAMTVEHWDYGFFPYFVPGGWAPPSPRVRVHYASLSAPRALCYAIVAVFLGWRAWRGGHRGRT